ncbi:mechanosensitive ion channel family protein [bacterium]|nr:MAG: mechanosensitive ion channel family protein [bacterium]
MHIDIDNALRQIQALANDLITLLPNLILALVLLGLAFVAARYIAGLVRSLAGRAGQSRGVGLLLGRIAQYVVLVLGFLVALSTVFPSFKARDLIQVLGIGGVAIGFAFKDIFQNFLAGIIILISRPFRIGDQIVVKSFEGTVEDIQTRATLLRTYDNRLVVIPNTVLFSEEVTVLTASDKRRSEYDVGIGYGDDIDRAKVIALRTLASLDAVERDPAPDVLTVGLDLSTVNLRVRWWTSPKRADVLKAQDEVLTALKKALTEEGIDLPFPVQVVLFHDQTEDVDGDRGRQREGWPAGKGLVPRAARRAESTERS